MSTKDYSNAQEAMVSTYLQWNRVSGSGAAKCSAGDVISDKFLGECKTHETKGQKIIFRQDVWNKISDEAMIFGRIPVLFVDDGSRKPYNTYCVTRKPSDISVIPDKEFNIYPYNVNFKKQLNFDPLKLENKVRKHENSIFIIPWIEHVLLMNLQTFNEYQVYA